MVKLAAFFRLVRLPNLVIVALTQCLLQYLVLVPTLLEAGYSPSLDRLHFALLVLDTVLIAAGGYLINDLLDYDMDLVNKPDKVFVNRFFSKNEVQQMYFLLNLVGFGLCWYLAGYVGNRALSAIYPIAAILLFLYSGYFKKWPLVGNLVVALFCAFVAGIVLFAERETFSLLARQQAEWVARAKILFGGYLGFAFLSTLLREIVKDMEDQEGDRQLGLHTLPIAFGIPAARTWALSTNLVLFLAVLFFSKWLFENEDLLPFAFSWIGLLLPLAAIAWLLVKAVDKVHFSRLSQLIKLVMLAGLLLLILC